MQKTILKFAMGLMLMVGSQLSWALVNINQDDAKVIAKELSGVGKAKAKAIVMERRTNGPFKSLDDLQKRVKGIGKKIVLKNKDVIRFK